MKRSTVGLPPSINKDHRDSHHDSSKSKRQDSQLTPFKIRSELAPLLSSRLGPADVCTPSRLSAEERLSWDAIHHGHKYTVDGVQEADENVMSLADRSDLWQNSKLNLYSRVINEQVSALSAHSKRKRKARQPLHMALIGSQVEKRGLFPGVQHATENIRQEWMDELAGRKRLRLLADTVPQRMRRSSLVSSLVHHSVPLARATWYIKSVVLNEVRNVQSLSAAGSMAKRSEVWTAELLEYGSDFLAEASSSQNGLGKAGPGGWREKPAASLESRWKYFMRLASWHFAEGILDKQMLLEWVLKQWRDRSSSLAVMEYLFQFLLQLLPNLLLVKGQVRILAALLRQWITTLRDHGAAPAPAPPAGRMAAITPSDSAQVFKRPRSSSVLRAEPSSVGLHGSHPHLTERMVHLFHLLVASVPEFFVGSEVSAMSNLLQLPPPLADPRPAMESGQSGSPAAAAARRERIKQHHEQLLRDIDRSAGKLTAAVSPSILRCNRGQVTRLLYKCMMDADVAQAFSLVFDDSFCCQGVTTVNGHRVDVDMEQPSDSVAVSFLCDWAICCFDSRAAGSCVDAQLWKAPEKADVMQRVYFVVSLLTLRQRESADAGRGRAGSSRMHSLVEQWLALSDGERHRHGEQEGALLWELAHASLFNPTIYLELAAADGVLQEGEVCSKPVLRRKRTLRHLAAALSLREKKGAAMLYPGTFSLGETAGSRASKASLSKRQRVGSRLQCDASEDAAGIGVRQRDSLGLISHQVGWLLCFPAPASAAPAAGTLAKAKAASRDAGNGKGDEYLDWLVKGRKKADSQMAAMEVDGGSAAPPGMLGKRSREEQGVDEWKVKERWQVEAEFHRDLLLLGSRIMELRLQEQRQLARWLCSAAHSLLEADSATRAAAAVEVGSKGRSSAVPEGGRRQQGGGLAGRRNQEAACSLPPHWEMTNRSFQLIVLVLDSCGDFPGIIDLLLLMLPAVFPDSNGGRDAACLCSVSSATFLTCLRQYQHLIASLGSIPRVLAALSEQASRLASTPPVQLLSTMFDLQQRYRSVPEVSRWDREWRVRSSSRTLAVFESARGKATLPAAIDPTSLSKAACHSTSLLEILHSSLRQPVLDILASTARSCDHFRDQVESDRAGGKQKDGTVAEVAGRVSSALVEAVAPLAGRESTPRLLPLASSFFTSLVETCRMAFADTHPLDSEDTWHITRLTGKTEAQAAILRASYSAGQILDLHLECLCLIMQRMAGEMAACLQSCLLLEAKLAVEEYFCSPPHCRHGPKSMFKFSPETPDIGPTDCGEEQEQLAAAEEECVAHVLFVVSFIAASVARGMIPLESAVKQLVGKVGPTGPQNEACLLWLRVLVGSCADISNGVLSAILGPGCCLSLARLQKSAALSTLLPPVFDAFSAAMEHVGGTQRGSNGAAGAPVLLAAGELVRHSPFRSLCLQDPAAFYDCACLLAGEEGPDPGTVCHVPFAVRMRLFVASLVGSSIPDDSAELTEEGFMSTALSLLDTLQPNTVSCQWLFLRVLLNEQVVSEKVGSGVVQGTATRTTYSKQGGDAVQVHECEKTFISALLTRLLLRPEAAVLYSELVHMLGKELEKWLILWVRWLLESKNILFGHKSLQQHLRQFAATHKYPLEASQPGNAAGSQLAPFALEKSLGQLLLPCLARSCDDTRSSFAAEMVRQMGHLEQRITLHERTLRDPSCRPSKLPPGRQLSAQQLQWQNDSGSSSSPAMGRKAAAQQEAGLGGHAAVHVSLWLRLQLLTPLLPLIYMDRDTSAMNMRHGLAQLILRLLLTRTVQEESALSTQTQDQPDLLSRPPGACSAAAPRPAGDESSTACCAAQAMAGESLFDRLLSILHALVSPTWVSWLKPRQGKLGSTKSLKDVPAMGRDVLQKMQAALDRAPVRIQERRRIQAVFSPIPPDGPLFPSAAPRRGTSSRSSRPKSLPAPAARPPQQGNRTRRSKILASLSVAAAAPRPRAPPPPPPPITVSAVDPWMMLEEGASGSQPRHTLGARDKATFWLRGALRVVRTDSTYVPSKMVRR